IDISILAHRDADKGGGGDHLIIHGGSTAASMPLTVPEGLRPPQALHRKTRLTCDYDTFSLECEVFAGV
ncbi:hypothetical protein, partial [Parahaliea maris]|uniref:hypothetical protein n=1 Tax=Parahaliea maris TaxID=2716870 RepID=UPI001BB418DE